jgi:hypothetical protein
MRWRLVLVLSLVLIILASGGCAAIRGTAYNFDKELNSIVRPYSFNFAVWEFNTLFTQRKQNVIDNHPDNSLNSQNVVRYFSYMDQVNSLHSDINAVNNKSMDGDIDQLTVEMDRVKAERDALRSITEQTIARQISETLASQGIYNPLGNSWFKLIFPPVNFRLEKPLYVLMVSPRDRIERLNEITIKQEISQEQILELEDSVDNLNVSSLVIEIGGMGATYPSFVIDNADLRFTIDVACEEWLHQYMVFKPLGLGYVLHLLGFPVNQAIPTINETVAGIAGRELGKLVYDRYYVQYLGKSDDSVSSQDDSDFDFNKEMRETRRMVDSLLASGHVEAAEKYMNEQQEFLASKGYYIRKLNQAYFAFHGSYADSPTSIDPIGDEIRALRAQSLSLKDFLDTASQIKNKSGLEKLVEG